MCDVVAVILARKRWPEIQKYCFCCSCRVCWRWRTCPCILCLYRAPREADVRRFTKGINGVSPYTGLSLVPIDQMAGVFSAAMFSAQKVNIIRPGDWVRLKKGPYRFGTGGCG
eukprot:symbB.v1.2.024531.t1/scaffold2327.1/size82221/2